MHDEQRYALHFGPYAMPLFQLGGVVSDAVRGDVTIVAITDGKIPWPVGKR
jgi:hypothetical protein